MSAIPGEPNKQKPHELTTEDGRKVKLKIPGLAKPPTDIKTEQRGDEEPPRDDPRPPFNPNHVGGI